VELGSGVVTDLELTGSNPRYVSTGHILFGHATQALMAVSFDLGTHSVTGEPLVVLPEVLVFAGGATQFDVSETGTAVVGLPGALDRQLVIVDQDGVETPLPLVGDFNHPRFSLPDGRRLVYENGNQIWIYDLATGANSPITSGWNYQKPWWSRDGQYVYYAGWTGTSAGYDGFRRLADASRDEEPLFPHEGHDRPLALSLDGTQMLMEVDSEERGQDMLLVPLEDDNPTFSDYLRADWNENRGTISPDGAWLAYVSDESGIPEVYLRSFPDADGQQSISAGRGTQPVWAPDGSAIYYREGVRVMKASLLNGGVRSVVSREALFEAQWLVDALGRHDWDVHPNGRSFVAVKGPATEETEVDGVPIIRVRTIVNWFEELKERVPN
jgi:serine/threonine-protein kinase